MTNDPYFGTFTGGNPLGEGPPGGPSEPASPSASSRRRVPRVAAAAGLAVGMALGGAGIAFAASSGSNPSTSSPSSSTPSGNPPAPGGHRGPRGGLGALGGLGLGGLGGRVLYGQATVQQPSGSVKTVEFQVGTVSKVSNNSITVDSPNSSSAKVTHTYTVDQSTVVDSQAGGISTVATGDQVRLTATQQNGNDTAVNIVDVTKIRSSRSGFGFGNPTKRPAAPTGQVWNAGTPGLPGSEVQ